MARKTTSRRKRGSPEYRIRVAFRVPREYAFAWCTDFSPQDASLEKEKYDRRVIERTPRRVIFEDLEDTEGGWIWSRDIVTLRPPSRWHMEGHGNRRDVVADYQLTDLKDGRTQLELRWKRFPLVRAGKELTKAQREASTLQAWNHFAAAMERDYREGKQPGPSS